MTIVNDIKLLFDNDTSSYIKDVIIGKWGNLTLTDVYDCYIIEQLQEELQSTTRPNKYIF